MSKQWNTTWNQAWPSQPSHEVLVDAKPVIARPNHHGVYQDAERVWLRFMRLYQSGLPQLPDGTIVGELVVHDLAVVEFTWEAAKDLYTRLGEELAREEARRAQPIERPVGCPYPMVADPGLGPEDAR